MFNVRIPIIISLFTILMGLLVTMAWIFDITALKSIIPNEITMKFSTAVSFVFSGIILYFVSNHYAGKIGLGQIAIPISGLVVFLFMATLLTTYIVGVPSGVEQLFLQEPPNVVKTKFPGVPSIPTAVCFLLIVATGMMSLNSPNKLRPISYIGYAVMAIGVTSLVGHLTSQPTLYYYVDDFNTGMAIHTSMLFVLIGFALSMLKATKKIIYSTVKIQTKLFTLFLANSIIPIVFVMGLNFNITQYLQPDNTNSIIIISMVTAFSVGIFSIFTAKSISRPIVELKNASTKISKGNFEVRAAEDSNDEIGELSKSFNQMVDSVIKAERLSTIGLLASRLGHDVRNNLTTILTTAGIIRKRLGFDTDKDLKCQVDMIERSALKINNQIEDVLNFVRFSPLKSEHNLLSKILQNTLKTIQVPAKIKIVLPQTDISVNCNANQFEIVLANLINNSIQAIEGDGEIAIDTREDDKSSIIEVKDSGPGIPSEVIPQIFEPLFTTKQKGTGLGLATCKNIVERHGGTIEVRNNPTTFTIKMPKQIT